MYCDKCGHNLRDDALFCSNCGTKVEEEKILITPEHRERVYKTSATVMLDGLDNGTITVEQSDDISHFVLDRLDNLKTQLELFYFLQELSNRWPVYKPYVMVMMVADWEKVKNLGKHRK